MIIPKIAVVGLSQHCRSYTSIDQRFSCRIFFKEISSFHSIEEGVHFLLGPLSHEREPTSKIDFLFASQKLFKNITASGDLLGLFPILISSDVFISLIPDQLVFCFQDNFRCMISIPQYEFGWLFWDYLSNAELR